MKFLMLLLPLALQAQDDSLRREHNPGHLYLLLYARVISDNNGNMRVDENVVGNIRVNRLLRIEAGFRKGERPGQPSAYYHYKLELQSRYFANTVRFIARITDNLQWTPTPTVTRTHLLLIAESRWPLRPSLSFLAATGYVLSAQRNNSEDIVPGMTGTKDYHGTYKVGLRYEPVHGHTSTELTWGTYDVFNPYPLQAPFLQVTSDYGLTGRLALYGYFRYQYDHLPGKPLNDFLGLGVRLRNRG